MQSAVISVHRYAMSPFACVICSVWLLKIVDTISFTVFLLLLPLYNVDLSRILYEYD